MGSMAKDSWCSKLRVGPFCIFTVHSNVAALACKFSTETTYNSPWHNFRLYWINLKVGHRLCAVFESDLNLLDICHRGASLKFPTAHEKKSSRGKIGPKRVHQIDLTCHIHLPNHSFRFLNRECYLSKTNSRGSQRQQGPWNPPLFCLNLTLLLP